MGMFALSHCSLEICNLFFFGGGYFVSFTRPHSYEFTLSLTGDLELELLSNARTVKTLGTLADELNAFCITGWTRPLGVG
jgi:hypothetical protein